MVYFTIFSLHLLTSCTALCRFCSVSMQIFWGISILYRNPPLHPMLFAEDWTASPAAAGNFNLPFCCILILGNPAASSCILPADSLIRPCFGKRSKKRTQKRDTHKRCIPFPEQSFLPGSKLFFKRLPSFSWMERRSPFPRWVYGGCRQTYRFSLHGAKRLG